MSPSSKAGSSPDYEMLRIYHQRYPRTNVVRFVDWGNSATDGGDPNRHCYVTGILLDLGIDADSRAWALVKLEKHEMQSVSDEKAVAPGYTTYMDAMYGGPTEIESVTRAIQQEIDFRSAYPETAVYLDIPFPNEPQLFYVDEMDGLILTPTMDDTES